MRDISVTPKWMRSTLTRLKKSTLLTDKESMKTHLMLFGLILPLSLGATSIDSNSSTTKNCRAIHQTFDSSLKIFIAPVSSIHFDKNETYSDHMVIIGPPSEAIRFAYKDKGELHPQLGSEDAIVAYYSDMYPNLPPPACLRDFELVHGIQYPKDPDCAKKNLFLHLTQSLPKHEKKLLIKNKHLMFNDFYQICAPLIEADRSEFSLTTVWKNIKSGFMDDQEYQSIVNVNDNYRGDVKDVRGQPEKPKNSSGVKKE